MAKIEIICSKCGKVAEKGISSTGQEYWTCQNEACGNISFTDGTPADNNEFGYYEATTEKVTRCPGCGEEKVELRCIMEDVTGYREMSLNSDGTWDDGELYLGEEVPDLYECLNCGHEENKLEAFIKVIIKPIPPRTVRVNDPDIYDVIEALIEKICVKCPHYGGDCMPTLNEEGDNYPQMLICVEQIGSRLFGVYPAAEEIIPYKEE